MTPAPTPSMDDELRGAIENIASGHYDFYREFEADVDAVMSLIQKDRQQLLARVKTEVIGEDESYKEWNKSPHVRNRLRAVQRGNLKALIRNLNGGKK